MKQILILKKLFLIFNLSTNLAFANNPVTTYVNNEMIDDYVSLITRLDYKQEEETLYSILQMRLETQSDEDVILRPLLALYRVEQSAGNQERAEFIKEMLLRYRVNLEDKELGRGLIGKKELKCQGECLFSLVSLPLRSFDELGEAFGAMGILDSRSSYTRTGLNSPEIITLLKGPFLRRDLIAQEYAHLLASNDIQNKTYNEHLNFINQKMDRYGFVEGLIKPFLITREMVYQDGHGAMYEQMNSLMGRFGIKNDFSIFAQRDLKTDDEFKKGEYLSKRMQYSASTSNTMRDVGESYLVHRVEEVVGRKPQELQKEAQNVKTVGDATLMMGRILFHTALDVASTAVSANNGKAAKVLQKVEYADKINQISGDQRQQTQDRVQKAEAKNPEVKQEPKQEAKQEPKEKPKEEPKQEKTQNDIKDEGVQKKQKEELPTQEDHDKNEEYLSPDILTIPPTVDENTDRYLTPEEKEEKRKAQKELEDSMVILTGVPDVDDKGALVLNPRPIVNPINSTPLLPLEIKEPIDLEKVLKEKKDIVINPGRANTPSGRTLF